MSLYPDRVRDRGEGKWGATQPAAAALTVFSLSSDKAPTAPLLTPHRTDREAASPAGYITGRSAVSAALDSAERRTAWPPGYATGAHVLAGCLPGHRSSAAELISTPTLSTVLSKHVSGCMDIQCVVGAVNGFYRFSD